MTNYTVTLKRRQITTETAKVSITAENVDAAVSEAVQASEASGFKWKFESVEDVDTQITVGWTERS